MTDMTDLVIRAVQKYGEDCGSVAIVAIAEDMGCYLVNELGLRQEWGVVTAFTYPRRGADGNLLDPRKEEIDTVTHVADHPTYAVQELASQEAYDREFRLTMANGRRYVGTRLFTEWQEEAGSSLDPKLVELAVDDG